METLTGQRPAVAIADRGYRGNKRIGLTEIITPKPPKQADTEYQKKRARKRFRRRAAIEPVIGHLKSDHRLKRCYLKGLIGDAINLMLAAAAFNLKKWVRDNPVFGLRFFWAAFTAMGWPNSLAKTA